MAKQLENIISNNEEIKLICFKRDYSKTLEEKIASLKDKAILEQTKNAKVQKKLLN